MKRVNVWKMADVALRGSLISPVRAQKPRRPRERVRKAANIGASERRRSLSAGGPFPSGDAAAETRSSALRVTARTLAATQLSPPIPKIHHDVMEAAAPDCSATNRVMCALG